MYTMPEYKIEAQRLFSAGMMQAITGNYSGATQQLEKAADKMQYVSKNSEGLVHDSYLMWENDARTFAKYISQKASKAAMHKREGEQKSEKQDDGPSFEMKTVPDIGFENIAGLEEVKQAVRMKAIYPFQHPELYHKLNKKMGGGILLYGLPGTGKTMIAKAIAHETGAKFFPIKGSDIASKWYGESEQNIRCLFEEAKKHEKAVVFFDEIESYTNRDGGDIMARVVAELLSQMQGINRDGNESKLLFIAATNRPWMVDGAFLRPGRFDEVIYVPLPDKEAREQIMKINLANVPLHEDVDLQELSKQTDGFNGADVDFLCEKAKDYVIRRVIEKDLPIQISMDDFREALNEVHSSTLKTDQIKLENWKDQSFCKRAG